MNNTLLGDIVVSPVEDHTQLLISVADNYLDRIPFVIQRLQAAGLRIEKVTESLGIVVGTAPYSKHEAIREVEGVSHIEESLDVQIPPPNSIVQ